MKLKKGITSVLAGSLLFFSLSIQAEERVWNLKDVEIHTLISEVSKVTGKNFVIGPNVNAKVTLISNHALSNDELYQAFLALLRTYGYAAIPDGEVINIVPLNSAVDITNPELLSKFDYKKERMVVTTVRVQNYPATDLVRVLRPLLPRYSYIEAYRPSNDLIISTEIDNLNTIKDLVKRMDQPMTDDIEVISLDNASAVTLAKTLTTLMPDTKNAAATGLGPVSAVRFIADDRTNSLLLSGGSAEQRVQYRGLISKLDMRNHHSAEVTQVVYLKYIPAETIAPILQGLIDTYLAAKAAETPAEAPKTPANQEANTANASSIAQAPQQRPGFNLQYPQTNVSGPSNGAGGSSSLGGGTLAPGEDPFASQLPRSGQLGPHVQWESSTNSVILTASADLLERLKEVINFLDIRRPQILIEAIIAEIEVNHSIETGVEWHIPGSTTFNTRFKPTIPNLSDLSSGKTSILPAIGQGLTLGFFKGDDLRALVRAISSDTGSNVLATPNLLTLDNEIAQIKVGSQISFAIGQINNNPTGGNPFTSYNQEDVGLTLTIKPQISPDGSIRLSIEQELSAVIPNSSVGSAGGNPELSQRYIKTTVMTENGQILVLGGLLQNQWSKSVQRVPILGDLPVIGAAFRADNTTLSKTNLMIFLRPIILYNDPQGSKLSKGKYEFLRQEQLKLEAGPIPKLVNPVLPITGGELKLPPPFS